MIVGVTEEQNIIFSDVFNPICIKTEDGTYGICQRDGGLEIVKEGELIFSSVHSIVSKEIDEIDVRNKSVVLIEIRGMVITDNPDMAMVGSPLAVGQMEAFQEFHGTEKAEELLIKELEFLTRTVTKWFYDHKLCPLCGKVLENFYAKDDDHQYLSGRACTKNKECDFKDGDV